jgi:hypothetical protein
MIHPPKQDESQISTQGNPYDSGFRRDVLGKQTPTQARRTLEQFEGSAPDALAQTNDDEYENQTRRLSL